MSYEIDIELTIDNTDVTATVEYDVTSWGSPGSGPSLSHPGDPPEAPEFEINSIKYQLEDGWALVEYDDLTELQREKLDEAIYLDIGERDNEPDYPEPDFD